MKTYTRRRFKFTPTQQPGGMPRFKTGTLHVPSFTHDDEVLELARGWTRRNYSAAVAETVTLTPEDIMNINEGTS